MHLVWPHKAIMIVLNWATHLASRAICLAIVIGVAACGPAPRKLDDPIFEFSRVCDISQSKLTLVDTVGITSLYSLGDNGLDYFVVQGAEHCGVAFRDYSPKAGAGPHIFSNSTVLDVEFPSVEFDGQAIPPFGSREFMQSYSEQFILDCVSGPNYRSTCVSALKIAASESVKLYFLPQNYQMTGSKAVTILNGSIYRGGKLLL